MSLWTRQVCDSHLADRTSVGHIDVVRKASGDDNTSVPQVFIRESRRIVVAVRDWIGRWVGDERRAQRDVDRRVAGS